MAACVGWQRREFAAIDPDLFANPLDGTFVEVDVWVWDSGERSVSKRMNTVFKAVFKALTFCWQAGPYELGWEHWPREAIPGLASLAV